MQGADKMINFRLAGPLHVYFTVSKKFVVLNQMASKF